MGIEHWVRDQYGRPDSLANFDSSTTMVRALSRHLHGQGFPGLGIFPRPVDRLLPIGNRLPRRTRAAIYRRGSANEAIDPDELESVDVEAIRSWVTDRYPERGYPAVLIGSASGAMIYLAALLGIPWLPQTFLVPVRRDVDPDEPRADLEQMRGPGKAFTAANPDIAIHHMSDPNQDRRPLPAMAYFRIKTLALGEAYRDFIETVLAPDGTIMLSDCTMEWPSTTVSERHYFQFGCIGGFDPMEYYEGSPRVRRFLERQGSDRRQWDPPAPDGRRAEAEWGLNDAIESELFAFAGQKGYRVRRLAFEHPRSLSPLVARCYRREYERRGYATNRLLASTFTQLDPWWTLRTGSIPYWLSFTVEDDAEALDAFLDETPESFEEIYVILFSHGVDSAGLAGADRWQEVLDRATDTGAFLGTDPDAFPFDFSSYVRYHRDIPRRIPDRVPLLDPMSLDRFEELVESRARDTVQLTAE